MKSLRNRLSAVALACVGALLAPMLLPGAAHADPIEDQRAYVASITDQLENLERQSDILAEDYVTAVDELNQLEGDVSDAEAAVAKKQAEVDELQGQLGEVALQAFMGGGASNVLGPLLGDSSEFTADMQRDELTRVALNSGTTSSDDLARAASELADEQQALQDQRDAAADKKQEVSDAQSATEAKTGEYQQARTDAEQELGSLIKEEEDRRAAESYRRMQAEAAAAQQRAAAAAAAQAQAQQQTRSASPASGGGQASSSRNNASSANNTSSGNNTAAAPAPAAPAAPAAQAAPAAPAAPTNPSIPAASSRAGTAVAAAMTQLGVSYRYAAASPGVAFDCSGLTSWAWGRAGVGLPHQSRQQYASIAHVPASAAQAGDLLFFYSPISHVGIYLGNGTMVHAPNSGSVVNVRAVNWGSVVGVGRPG